MNGGTGALLRDEEGYTHIEGLRGVAIMVTAELKEFAKGDKPSIPCKGRWCERWCEGCSHRATEVEGSSPRRGGLPTYRETSWSRHNGDRSAQGGCQGRQTIDHM